MRLFYLCPNEIPAGIIEGGYFQAFYSAPIQYARIPFRDLSMNAHAQGH